MLSKAKVCFNNGYVLEFEPAQGQATFPHHELVRLNNFAKARSGVLFVHVDERPQSSVPQLHKTLNTPQLKKSLSRRPGVITRTSSTGN